MLDCFKTLKQHQESMAQLCSFQERKQSILGEQSDCVKPEMPKRHYLAYHRCSRGNPGYLLTLQKAAQLAASKQSTWALTTLDSQLLPNSAHYHQRELGYKPRATATTIPVLAAVVLKQLPAGLGSNCSFVHQSHR